MDTTDSIVSDIEEVDLDLDLEFFESVFPDEEFGKIHQTSLNDIKNFLDDLDCDDFIEKNIFEQFENNSCSEVEKEIEQKIPESPPIQIMTKRGALTVNPIQGCDISLLRNKIDNKDKKIMRLIDSLKVPLHDKRRKYMSDFFSYYNSYDFKAMKAFLLQNSVGDNMLGHFEIINTDIDVQVILPKKIYIRGLDAILSFIESFLRAVPDFIVFTSDTVIRNRSKSSTITTNLAAHGTRVYKVVLNNSPDNAIVSKDSDSYSSFNFDNNKKRKNETINSTLSSDRSINITDLCDQIEKIDLSDNISETTSTTGEGSDNKEKNKKTTVHFQSGPLLPRRFKLETVGTAAFHLNAEHKICLYEYKVTHKKTIL